MVFTFNIVLYINYIPIKLEKKTKRKPKALIDITRAVCSAVRITVFEMSTLDSNQLKFPDYMQMISGTHTHSFLFQVDGTQLLSLQSTLWSPLILIISFIYETTWL